MGPSKGFCAHVYYEPLSILVICLSGHHHIIMGPSIGLCALLLDIGLCALLLDFGLVWFGLDIVIVIEYWVHITL